jgi:hypothetical protein
VVVASFDWATFASIATAVGTLVLAFATFSATRSSNRSARVAEQALMTRIRPLLIATRFQDPPEKVMWRDQHFARIEGGRGAFEQDGDAIYLAGTVRNAGTGLAVLHGWHVRGEWGDESPGDPVAPDAFRRLSRDLYIAPGDIGFWQGAIRDGEDPDRERVQALLDTPVRFAVDVLYGDQEGGQRTITRFGFTPYNDTWLVSTSRHWFLDRADPR